MGAAGLATHYQVEDLLEYCQGRRRPPAAKGLCSWGPRAGNAWPPSWAGS